MKKLLLVSALAGLAAGCASGGGDAPMGYAVTEYGEFGCAFRYGFYPYYDSSAAAGASRMDVVLISLPRVPREVDRSDFSPNAPWSGPTYASGGGDSPSSVTNDRAPIAASASAPPPPPRAVGPRD